MIINLFAKHLIHWAKDKSEFLVPVKTKSSTEDLLDHRTTRYVAADGTLLNYSICEADLVSPTRFGAEMLALFSIILLLFTGASGAVEGLISMVAVMFLIKSGFANQSQNQAPPNIIVAIFFGLIVIVLGLAHGVAGGLATIVATLASLFLIFWKWRQQEFLRNAMLSLSAGMFSAETSSDAIPALIDAESEREEQNARAMKDTSTFFPLAVATGLLSQKGDIYASERGQVVGLTEEDATTHLFTFGATGTGKTATQLRPFYNKWQNHKIGGALVLDGKGDLPREFAEKNPDFFLLDPTDPDCTFNLIHGLKADEIAEVLVEVMGSGNPNDFWESSAAELIKNCAFVLDFAQQTLLDEADRTNFAWNLCNLFNTVTGNSYREVILKKCEQNLDDASPLIKAAHLYLTKQFMDYPDEMRGSIVGTASALLAPIASHTEIFRWASTTENGFSVEKVLEGAHVGIATPPYKYGKPGLAVQALAKARIYRAIRQRGSNWRSKEGQTKVLLMIDECQMMLGRQDDIFAVARSLGLSAVCATQHVEGLHDALGKEKAESILGNFSNLVCFRSSYDTLAYMSKRMGASAIRVEHENSGIDYQKIMAIADSGGAIQQVDQGRAKQADQPTAIASFKRTINRVVTEDELSFVLSPRFTAAVLLNRANSPRRSIAQFEIGGID